MNPPPLQQLRDEALTMLVLWAASKDYSPDIEHMLKMFAKTFEISEQDLTNRLIQAADGKLTRPDANASSPAEPAPAAGASVEAAATAPPLSPATAPPPSSAPAPAANGGSEQQINSEQQPTPAADGQQQPTEPEPMQQ